MGKIKLLVVLEATLGGTRKHVFDILKHIDLSKFEVTFCYTLIRADQNFFKEFERIKERGIALVEIQMYREISLLNDLKAFIKIFKLVRKERYDLIHVHSSKAGILGRLAAKLVSQKIITVYTPNSMPININKFYKFIEKAAIPFTNKIIAVSESEKKEIIENKLTKSVIKINSGVHVYTNKIKNKILSKELKINDDTVIVVSIGRLTKQKDPLTFFKAINEYVNILKSNSAFFVWIGDGELRIHVDEYIQSKRLNNYCRILGWKTNIEELLWGADIFVLTSIYESFGYVTCEAMSHFLPVIATNVVGTSDIVIDNECGFLVDKGDYKEISKKISTLVNDKTLREEMGEKGNERIKQHFNVIDMVKNTEDLYLKLLDKKIVN